MQRRSLSLQYEDGTLRLLDQRLLPQEECWVDVSDPEDLISAIKSMLVRGAPIIGVAAAFCMAPQVRRGMLRADFLRLANALREARPTAVNLMWAVDRMLAAYNEGRDLEEEAAAIFDEDVQACAYIAANGAELIEHDDHILTHCNTGGLATAGIGTALGAILQAHRDDKRIHVWVSETRPLLQGARLTAWECECLGIPYTLITDGMSGSLMRDGRVNRVIVGADRIALNGDFANKVGTLNHAIAAHHYMVPFHVAAPWSTVDKDCIKGDDIKVEQRAGREVRGYKGVVWAPPRAHTYNPAFDVTDGYLVSSFILEDRVATRADVAQGVLRQRYKNE